MIINLRKLKINQKGIIREIKGFSCLSKRIRDMGIIVGSQIKVVGRAPLNDPVALKIKGQVLTLRNNEADFIFVEIEVNEKN